MTSPAATPATRETEQKGGRSASRSAVLGAVFLMATSAFGPGFITQTATFTVRMGAAFACAISAVLAIGVFLSRRAGVALDRVVVVLGALMILATLGIAVTSGPPVGEALTGVVLPKSFDFLAVTTIIGGTVGGYITNAGAHRLLDSGRTGAEHVGDITRSSVVSILVTGLMRVLLFLAATAAVYVAVQETPVTLPVFAGTFNGLILPIGFGMLLRVAWRRRDLLGGYRYPAWLLAIGVLAWVLTLHLGYNAVIALGDL